jgi:hypothetical protein
MTNMLELTKKSTNRTIKLSKRLRNQFNTLKNNISINNISIKNNPELNTIIYLFLQKVNQMLQKVDQITTQTQITNNYILISIKEVKYLISEINILLKSSKKNKYMKIMNNIEKIRRFIVDIIDKRSEFTLNNDITNLSDQIMIEIEELNRLIWEISESINNNIQILEEIIIEKKKVRQALNNQLEKELSKVNKPFLGILRSKAQKKYNLTQSSIKNIAIQNKNSLNKQINYLEHQLKIAKNTKKQKTNRL